MENLSCTLSNVHKELADAEAALEVAMSKNKALEKGLEEIHRLHQRQLEEFE